MPRSSCDWRKWLSSLAARSASRRTSFKQFADLGLDDMHGFAHPRIAQNRLRDLDRHHQQRGRDDHDSGAVGLLHDFVEMLGEIRQIDSEGTNISAMSCVSPGAR